jgi:hypothetical protein
MHTCAGEDMKVYGASMEELVKRSKQKGYTPILVNTHETLAQFESKLVASHYPADIKEHLLTARNNNLTPTRQVCMSASACASMV